MVITSLKRTPKGEWESFHSEKYEVSFVTVEEFQMMVNNCRKKP